MANTRLSLIDIGRPGDPAVFDADVRAAALEIIARYPVGQARSALLPMLHLVQSEQGYVTADGIAFCAELLGLTKAQVAAVATFYTMYKRRPTGEYLVSVCTNTMCACWAATRSTARCRELPRRRARTRPPALPATGSITLEHAECLAACDYAPVVTVNYEFFDNQSVESAVGLVTELRAGNRPQPTRGRRCAAQGDLTAARRLRRPATGRVPGDGDRPADRGRGPAGPATGSAGAELPAR